MQKILVFTAPSGAGKTTLVRHLLRCFPDRLAFSVSATTREPRPHERDGVDYYFLTPEEFRRRVEARAFLEFEEVYKDQLYGTLRTEVERIWAEGKCVIFDVEVNGAKAIKAAFPGETQVVFVAPPSRAILFERLRARATESEESLRRRIARAGGELARRNDFDYVLVNDDLGAAKREAEGVALRWLDRASETP